MSPLIPKPTTGRGAFIELVVIVALAIGLALLIQAFVVKPYQIPSASMEPTLDIGQRVLVDRVSYHFSDPEIGDIVVFHPPEGAVTGDPQCGAPQVTPADIRDIRRSRQSVEALSKRFTIPPSTVQEIRAGQTKDVQLPGQVCPEPVDQEADTNFIKRIVAGPGDVLKVVHGRPLVKSEVTPAQWRNNEPPPESYIRPCGTGTDCNLKNPVTIPPNEYFMMGDNRGSSDDSRFWGPVPRDWIIGDAFATYWPPDRIGFL